MPEEKTPRPKRARVSRRVKWVSPDSTENVGESDTTVPESDRPESWGDESTGRDSGSNDEQLKRDKPPHWG